MVDKTPEAFGLTYEEMEKRNRDAADQMLPLPYDIEPRVNVLELPRTDFLSYLDEVVQDDTPRRDFLIREYNKANSLTGGLSTEPEEGRRSVAGSGGFLSKPEGESGLGALSGLRLEPAVGAAGIAQGLEQAITATGRSAQGLMPSEDTTLEALGVAGMATAGGVASRGSSALDFDPNIVSSFGIRNRSENNSLASKETFSGNLDSLHGYGSWFVGEENAQKTSFVPKDSYAGERYDSTGGTFGSRGVYLERVDDREFSDPTNPILTYPNYMVAEVPFKNAFVINPTTVGKLREYLDSVGYGGGNFSNPELGDVLTKKLESEGYDGVIVTGFQRPSDFTGNSWYEEYNEYVQGLGIPEEFMQSQVFKFNPEEIKVKDQLSYDDVFEVVPDVEAEAGVFNETNLDSNLLSTNTSVGQSNLNAWSEGAYFKDPETGMPETMYHGMSGNLRGQPVEFSGENLEPSYMGTLGPGTYLTRDPSVASDFATGKRGGYTDEKFGGQVIPVYTNVTKVVDDDVINSNRELRTEIADLIEENTDDSYLFNLADKLRGEDDINLSSLFTKTEDGKVRSTGVGSLVSSLLESKGYEGISVVTDKGFHEAVIFPGHGGVEFPRQNIKSSLQGPEGQYSRETNDMRFAEGGLAMERQMNTMMAEGGIKDSGMNRDPISGNEIPAGSLAKEVRDDVDAKLSEGEYVVPADVVRYFGVNYFEKLRQKAKAGLEEMDKDGRIGGDPVGAPMGDMDDDLSDEEMAMLNEMFKGGFVTSAGYQEGGDVTSGITNQYQLPGSVFGTSPPPAPAATPTTLYGPSGDVMTLMLPVEQERYNQLISEGYSTKPVEAPTTGTTDTGSDRDSTPSAIATPEVTGGEGFNPFSLNEEETNTLSEDPLAFGMGALDRNSLVGSRGAGVVGGAAAGPMGLLVGAGLGGLVELQDLAKARAALIVAKDKGLTDSEDYRKLEREIESKEKGLNTVTRGLDRLFGDFFSGNSLAESIKASPATIAPLTTQAIPIGSSTPSSTVIPRNVPNLSAAISAGSTRDEPTSAGIAYDTDASGRKTIVPGTSAAPDRSVRPVAAPRENNAAREKEKKEAQASAQRAADRGGRELAKGGRATGGLVQRPKKKPVAKK